MLDIDLLQYQEALILKKENGKNYIFDPIRNKYMVLQPEEMVRQLMINYLLEQGYNKNRMAVEKLLVINEKRRRFDLLVYHQNMKPFLLVECKAPEVKLSQSTLDQIARYNLPLKASYLLITNGPQTHCCRMNYQEKSYSFIDQLPAFPKK